MHGARQLIFVTGEPGIGKTTLVEAFRQKLEAEVYNWFTKGFDTKDLQEAKTLLDELSQ